LKDSLIVLIPPYATLVAVPKQHNANAEKSDLRTGRISEDWQDKPARLSHMDRHTRWTLKFTKTKRQDDGTIPTTDLAIPFFGYKSYVSIDRKFRFIRKCKTTDTAASVGARLREGLLDQTNTALTVWADRAVRPDCRCHPGRHDDQTGQYHLQHAPLPLPGTDQSTTA